MVCQFREFVVLMGIGLLVFLGGCSEDALPVEGGEAESAVEAAESDARGSAAGMIVPGVGVGEARLGMSVDELKAALGEPDIDATGISYVYADLGVEVVFRDGRVHSIHCVEQIPNAPQVRACGARTAEGIGIGSTEAEIVAAYGEPTKRSTNALMYAPMGYRFELVEGQVRKVMVLRPW